MVPKSALMERADQAFEYSEAPRAVFRIQGAPNS